VFNPAEAPPFSLRTTVRPDRHVLVALGGELDMVTVGLVDPAVDAIIRVHQPAAVEIDLTFLHFISCCGVNALVKAHHRALHAGCRLVVTHPQSTVLRVLALTGVWRTLQPSLASTGSRG
jgi:anti-anti-sigma factor